MFNSTASASANAPGVCARCQGRTGLPALGFGAWGNHCAACRDYVRDGRVHPWYRVVAEL